MSPEELLEALLELARDLDLEVRSVGPDGPQTSGLCRLRGRVFVLLTRGDPLERRIGLMAEALWQHAPEACEERYLPPAVRAALEAGAGRSVHPA